MISFIKRRPKVVALGFVVIVVSIFPVILLVRGGNVLNAFSENYWVIILVAFPFIAVVGILKTVLSVFVDKAYEKKIDMIFSGGSEFREESCVDVSVVFADSMLLSLRKRAEAEKALAIGLSLTALAVLFSIILAIVSQSPASMGLSVDDFLIKMIAPKAAVIVFIEVIAAFFLKVYSRNMVYADAVELFAVKMHRGMGVVNLSDNTTHHDKDIFVSAVNSMLSCDVDFIGRETSSRRSLLSKSKLPVDPKSK